MTSLPAGHVDESRASFKDLLYRVWFEPYPRSPRYNTTDSSGFEHVFVGEARRRKVSVCSRHANVPRQDGALLNFRDRSKRLLCLAGDITRPTLILDFHFSVK